MTKCTLLPDHGVHVTFPKPKKKLIRMPLSSGTERILANSITDHQRRHLHLFIKMKNIQRIELPAAADMHVHLRQGELMDLVVPTVLSGGVDTVFV